ncbi:hypothetical protein IB238_13820 [Rhizobium sp. ARZ01]|uniref:hypothetical protein n=1 Tax=Rhizobium sp. ARZ01 TaxID=2769313 RepID=UPI00178488A0|nr:hypothetical protein [Rhizobium sp. ARZ01]MBD9373701.1 hypothetical protein [Rhizobium sp. ARZ01]
MPEDRANGVEKTTESLTSESEARRAFLKKAGRFAAVTPPSITLLLGTSLSSRAIAKSNGSRPGHGWGDKNHTHYHKKHSDFGGGKHKR